MAKEDTSLNGGGGQPLTPKKKKKTSEKIKSFFSVGSSKSSPKSNHKLEKSNNDINSFEERSSSSSSKSFTLEDDESSTNSTISNDDSLHNTFNPTKMIQSYKHHLEKRDQPLLNDKELGEDSNYGYNNNHSKLIPKPAHIKFIKKSNSTPEIVKRLFLAQQLSQNFTREELDSNPQLMTNGIKNSVWVLKFNNDGKFMASAGKGNTIKVWKVLSTPLDKLQDGNSSGNTLISDDDYSQPNTISKPAKILNDDNNNNNNNNNNNKEKPSLFAPVFQNNCYRHFIGHEHDILSLDWSKNDFILSSSMDKTVRLWNLKQKHALRIYQHPDFVTCVKFHPTDDRFFVSGCLDNRVRLWSILDNDVVYEFNVKNLVTSIGFTPNGSLLIVGTFTGVLYFLDTPYLELRHSIDLQKPNKSIIKITSSESQGSSCKVTGIESFQDANDIKILITTNDSKIRMLSLRDKSLEYYFKGHDNKCSQIIATVSDDKKYVICGSENHWTYIWELESNQSHEDSLKNKLHNKKKRKDYVSFHSNHSVVTAAIIAPKGTVKSLALSNDYIYELNNEYYNNFTPTVDHLPDQATSTTTTSSSSSSISGLFQSSYIGNIIVTADDRGLIKIFRKDLSSEIRNKINSSHKSPIKKLTNKETSDTNLHRLSSMSRSTLMKNTNGSSTSLLRTDSFSQRLRSSTTGFLSSACKNSNGDASNNNLHQSGSNGILTGCFNNGGGISPAGGRSRSGTVNSIQRSMNELDMSNSNNLVCDICNGDKFKVVKGDNQPISGKDICVYCVECGNLVNT